ncbi:MAG: hypothetical protein QM783_00870 [Phycisphaerales bacterium]
MMTMMAATVMTLSMINAVPAQTKPAGASTLALAMPPPGSWALMGLGGLALLRARRKPQRVERATETAAVCNRAA